MKKQTKIRIRKLVSFARTLIFAIALVFFGIALCSVNAPTLTFTFVCLGIGAVCLAISFALDYLLFETAYNSESIFYH